MWQPCELLYTCYLLTYLFTLLSPAVLSALSSSCCLFGVFRQTKCTKQMFYYDDDEEEEYDDDDDDDDVLLRFLAF